MKRVLIVLSLFVVMTAGVLTVLPTMSVAPPAEASACRCPLIYAPVSCDHGQTYPNQCVADCHHAKNCVPTGEL